MTFASVATAVGIGIALAAAPGPVQAVLLAESIRGGVSRGLRALAGVHITFALLLVSLAAGLSVSAPPRLAVRLLQAGGGLYLLGLAVDALRSADGPRPPTGRRTLPVFMRGALAILLNPGAWLFLAVVASPLFAAAARATGTASAVLTALGLVVGAALGDLALVFVGGVGLTRTGRRAGRYVRLGLAAILAGLGLWLLLSATLP